MRRDGRGEGVQDVGESGEGAVSEFVAWRRKVMLVFWP